MHVCVCAYMCICVVMCVIVVSIVRNIMHSGFPFCVEDECYANLFHFFSSLSLSFFTSRALP